MVEVNLTFDRMLLLWQRPLVTSVLEQLSTCTARTERTLSSNWIRGCR